MERIGFALGRAPTVGDAVDHALTRAARRLTFIDRYHNHTSALNT